VANHRLVLFDCCVLTGIHIFALNLIAPQLVGRRLRLNAVAITVSLLFWGWVGAAWDCCSQFQLPPRCESCAITPKLQANRPLAQCLALPRATD